MYTTSWISACVLLTLILFSGCRQEDPSPFIDLISPVETTQPVIDLISPVETTQPDCCIEFKWSSNIEGWSRLQISGDSNFRAVIVDTVVETNSFRYEKKLAPNTTYYWQVKIGTLVRIASFTVENILPVIELIHPVEAILPSCCTEFKWSLNILGNSRLQISENSTFNKIILDTLITNNSFVYNKYLVPNAKYYWKVGNGAINKVSSFTVENIPARYAGVYPARVKMSCWGGAGNCDTSFTSTIELIASGTEIRIKSPVFQMDKNFYFNNSKSTSNKLVYENNYTSSSSASLAIYTAVDSLFIANSEGGLGGGAICWFRCKKK